MPAPARPTLFAQVLLTTAFSAFASAQERPFTAWTQTADVKTAPEPSRTPDVVPDRGPRPAGSPDADAPAPSKSIDPRAPISSLRGIDHTRTHFDEPGDGSLWARGANYKTSFDAAGATYYPLFGRRQQQHHPHALSPDSVTIGGQPVVFERTAGAVRAGDRVELDRGTFVEAYDFTPGSIEQTFVFAALPGAGDLVVHIPLASALESSECAEGFEFRGEHGKVSYGRATAIDAAGRSVAAATTLEDGGITIRVDAGWLSFAALPLVIDPVVSTFDIDTTSYDNYLADVAYDATYDRWLVVYEEVATAGDMDVYHVVLNGTGGFLWGGYLNSNNASWADVRCANLNVADQFLVVSSVTGSGATNIRGRTVNAAFHAPGGEFDISGTGDSGAKIEPSVGGDPYPTGASYYCVAYTRIYSGSDDDVLVRLVGPDGSVSATNYLSNSGGTHDQRPCVSRSNGGSTWVISWERWDGGVMSDIWGGRIRYDGFTLNGPFQITSGSYDFFSCVSSPLNGSQRTMVVWQHDYGTDHDIQGVVLDGATVVHSFNLTILENLYVFQDQRYPYVDSDGQHFLVGYAEQYGTSLTDYDVFVTDLYLSGNSIGIRQLHHTLAFTFSREGVVRLASKQGAGAGNNQRFMAVWEKEVTSTNWDILGGLFDNYPGGAQATVCPGDGSIGNCPCGNNGSAGRGCRSSVNTAGALLAATGSLSTWTDTTVLTASGMPNTAVCLFFQGNNVNSAAAFGDGLVCVGGGVVRLGTKTASGGSTSYPGGGDLPISVRGGLTFDGGRRAYQVWYRNSASFCTSSTFNLTNGVRIDWAR